MIVKIIQIHKISVPFNDMIKACQMSELSRSGNSFTWGGKRNNKWIQYKLDRCLEIKIGIRCFLPQSFFGKKRF